MNAAICFSERFDQALILASLAHAGALRKGTAFPYAMHPVHVARLLERHGFSEDVAIAGLLHDVLEDAEFGAPPLQEALRRTFTELAGTQSTGGAFRAATEALIASRFGPAILDLVLAVTEVKAEGTTKRPWRVRKDEQLAHIPHMSRDAAALKAADALHNAQSILRDVRRSRLEVWSRFNCTAEETLWHYGALADMLRTHLAKHPLALELDEAVFELTEEVNRLLNLTAAPRCSFCGSEHQPTAKCAKTESLAFVVTTAGVKRIRSLAHWRRLAPPAGGDRQWVEGRSALETARAWSGLTVPAEVLAALRQAKDLHDFRPATVFAELATPLDELGEGRHHDLVVLGVAHGKRVLVGIEAKNDEELGPEIGAYLSRAELENKARIDQGQTRLSQVPTRIANLTKLVFGTREIDLASSRYQLLHGLSGTLIEAARREAQAAVFLIHVFTSGSTNRTKAERNEDDLLRFGDLLQPGGSQQLRSGRLMGPVAAAGDHEVPAAFPFYFGIARTTCADRLVRASLTNDSEVAP